MARPLRIEYPGAVYHITSRGNARGVIYATDVDRHKFLEVLAATVKKYNWLCHAYCLMDNHYHLIVETPDPNLSMGMRHLNGVYTQAFNRTHQRVGHVFQGRYKSILVEKESYLLELCRYVVLNPVRAGMVSEPDSWKWSSFKSTAYARSKADFLSTDWILAHFSKNSSKARGKYRKFVSGGSGDEVRPLKDLVGQVFLGGESFVSRMEELFGDKREIKEIPRSQRYPGRPPLHRLFGENPIENREHRNNKISDAHVSFGYTLKEIADHLDLHYTTISKIVSRRAKK